MQGSSRVGRRLGRTTKAASLAPGAKVRAVGYARVSTEGQQVDGYGLEVQERAIRAFALSQGYVLADLIRDTASGATPPAEREGFGKVAALAAEDGFAVLLLYKFDRLARSVLHAVNTVHTLKERHGVVVRSVTEPLDTSTPMGEMIFTVLAGMAQQERRTIAERTDGGRREKARRGGYACGRVPYGYRADGSGNLVVDATQAAVVQRIYAERGEGLTLAAIRDRLNADGVPGPSGGRWHTSRVAYLLDNPKYRGAAEYLFTWSGTEQHVLVPGAHEAIV